MAGISAIFRHREQAISGHFVPLCRWVAMRFIARMRNKLESEIKQQTIGIAGNAACAKAKKHQTSCASDPARWARRNRPEHTSGVIAAGNIAGMKPECVRVSDLGCLVGIKRGLTYRKINGGSTQLPQNTDL